MSDLPPFKELVKDYDADFCKVMIVCIEHDLGNLTNRSPRMIELAAKVRGLSIEDYENDQTSALKERIELLNNRINELS